MSYITDSYALSGETLVKQFKKRNMEAFYCATKEEAKEKILSMIPNGSSVTWGGTESMEEACICILRMVCLSTIILKCRKSKKIFRIRWQNVIRLQ